MDFIDIAIYVSIVFFAIVGYNNGFFRSLLNIFGFIASLYITFILRDTIAEIFMLNLPFLEFGSLLKMAPALNVLLYHTLAFIILFAIAELLFNVLVSVLGLGDKALSLDVKARFLSKILGILTGLVEGVIIVFLVIIVLRQPFVRLNIVDNSSVAKDVLKLTPLLSDWNRDIVNVLDGVDELTETESITNANVITLLLDQNMLKKDTLKELLLAHKIKNDEEIMKIIDIEAELIENE